MNWGQFFNVSVAGIPLVLLILGWVEWLKEMGLAGRRLLAASLVSGLVLGAGYQLSQLNGWPVNFAGWFAVVIYGLALGLMASKVYDSIGSAALRTGAKKSAR